MIIVSVQLDSAISKTRNAELARVEISNIGPAKPDSKTHFNYHVKSLRGRNKQQLDLGTIQRQDIVANHASEREHVLNLVAKALNKLGYGK